MMLRNVLISQIGNNITRINQDEQDKSKKNKNEDEKNKWRLCLQNTNNNNNNNYSNLEDTEKINYIIGPALKICVIRLSIHPPTIIINIIIIYQSIHIHFQVIGC